MLEQDRADDMVTGVVRLFDGMVERHIEQLRDAFKKRARELYGRRSEQLSDAQLELLFELFQEQVEEASAPELTGAAGELDPWAYVKDALGEIASDWPQHELDRLLPDRCADEHPEALRRQRPA